MNIHYTLHALERMRQRGIERSLVEKCLKNPDKEEGLGDDVYKCVKRINRKVIIVIYKVIYKRAGDAAVIITAYISSKIHKYLE